MTDQTATIGHNAPPPDLEDFALLAAKVQELTAGADRMIDSIAEIADPATAQRVADFDKTQLHPLLKRIEDRRKKAVQPHLDAQRQINEAHKSLTAYLEKARQACNRLLTPWLQKQAEAERRRQQEAEAEARRLQQEALKKAAEAQSIQDQIAADEAQKQAAAKAKEASTVQRASVSSSYGARATSLRTYYRGQINDLTAILAHYRKRQDTRLLEAVQHLVDQDIRSSVGLKSGVEKLPGVTVLSEQKAA